MELHSTKLHAKKGLHSGLHIIRTRTSSYDENFRDFKKLTKNDYCSHSVVLLESICAVENKYYPQTFLHKFFKCNSIECNNLKS